MLSDELLSGLQHPSEHDAGSVVVTDWTLDLPHLIIRRWAPVHTDMPQDQGRRPL
jgi:hypothetical protein